jgi:hypothetical protein
VASLPDSDAAGAPPAKEPGSGANRQPPRPAAEGLRACAERLENAAGRAERAADRLEQAAADIALHAARTREEGHLAAARRADAVPITVTAPATVSLPPEQAESLRVIAQGVLAGVLTKRGTSWADVARLALIVAALVLLELLIHGGH